MDGLAKVPTPSQIRNNSVFELVLLVVVVVIGYWFLIKPAQAELTGYKAQYDVANRQLELVNADKQKLDDLIRQFNDNSSKILKLDSALPLNSKLTLVYIMFNDLAQRSGVTLNSLSVNGKGSDVVAGDKALLEKGNEFKNPRSLGKMTVGVTVVATFPAFENFLKQVEQSGRIINISSVSVSASTSNTLNFQLTMETYYYE